MRKSEVNMLSLLIKCGFSQNQFSSKVKSRLDKFEDVYIVQLLLVTLQINYWNLEHITTWYLCQILGIQNF